LIFQFQFHPRGRPSAAAAVRPEGRFSQLLQCLWRCAPDWIWYLRGV